MDKKITAWFTMNGKHIPIYEGESKEEAVNRSIADSNEDKKAKDMARNKQVADTLNNRASVTSGKDAIANLEVMKVGTPVKLQLTKDNGFKQAIYAGKGEVQGRSAYRFYDGEGIDGTFGLSDKFLSNHDEVKLKLNDNSPEAVAKLLKEMKGKSDESKESNNNLAYALKNNSSLREEIIDFSRQNGKKDNDYVKGSIRLSDGAFTDAEKKQFEKDFSSYMKKNFPNLDYSSSVGIRKDGTWLNIKNRRSAY